MPDNESKNIIEQLHKTSMPSDAAASTNEVASLARAFELFNETTRKLSDSYHGLQDRVKQLDQELAAKNHELALTGDYLKSILESMSNGVIAVDTDNMVTTFNHAASRVLGFHADEIVGRSFGEMFGRPFSVPLGPQSMALRAKSGVSVPVTERDSPITDRSKRRIGMVKVFEDLTELEMLREQVRRMDRLAAIGEMAATVAHEIRNPLGGIRGFAMLLSRDIPPEDPRARLVEKILAGTESLNRVVTELLEYTRPLEVQLSAIACRELVQNAIGFVEVDEARIKVKNNVESGIQVLADNDKMRQVLLNILLNAVQSIDKAGEIEVSASCDEDHITIAIADTGCGMAEEQLKKAFSPFYTTKERGTGLGLAVAARIVDAHGGSVEAKSMPGEGATFYVRLMKAE